ncbi:S1C family serine protease [Bifidobacterium gallicum]|uniref:Peptidase n=1 Tax=Bifidobacterium gallicum DSM 20093 = LMG 11596 TaxID=561180 RepID=D1NW52_9BIFI|nr:trypsin-like peptidase domain-containing protein [Bifidobacterium gallicum]EFA22338.1 trypsin [Bifidobacterium gallicum DSM 20093 = LMG 11596]KFI60052.1 peptidase [Bifidobacterium gallicum DSM 20093 = LMG 11596]
MAEEMNGVPTPPQSHDPYNGQSQADPATSATTDGAASAAPATSTEVSAQPTEIIETTVQEQQTETMPTQPIFQQAPQYGAYAPTSQPVPHSAPTGVFAQQNLQPTSPAPMGGNPYGGMAGVPNGPVPPNGPGSPFGPANPNNPNNGNGPAMQDQPRTASNVVVAVVAALVSAALCLGIGFMALTNGWVSVPQGNSLTSVSSNKSGSGSAKVEGGNAPDWITVSNNVSPSVVAIQTQMSNGSAKGSGAILDTEGHVVTNNHVVAGAERIQINLDNGDIYEAKVVGTDKTTDLAVLQIQNPPKDLKPITFADSSQLAPGENVMAIGNPLGYDGTVTSGIISALNRPVSVVDGNTQIVANAVQIDAAINPGNSGGPTFNAAGQVIGINSSIASNSSSESTAGSIGIGFAIPSNLVKRICEEIIKDGKAQHVALGVTIKSATVTADGVTRGGAQVQSVVSGGPADKAGIKAGDTIVAYDGNAVNDNYSLLGFVRAAAMNSTAKITLVRDGHTIDVDVTFDRAEQDVNGTNRQDSNNQNDQNGQNGNRDQNNGQDQNGQNGQNGQDGQDLNGQNDQNRNGDRDSGNGFTDPFGLW